MTAAYDGVCRLWDLSSYDVEKTLIKQKNRIRSMAVASDGTSVFLGLQSGKILMVNIGNAGEKSELSGHTDIVSALSVDPTGQYIASASWDRTIRIWSLNDNTKAASGKLVAGIASIAWSPDGTKLYSADLSGSVKEWTPPL